MEAPPSSRPHTIADAPAEEVVNRGLTVQGGFSFGSGRAMLREHMTNAIRILGLDPGLRRTGWGVVQVDGARLAHLAHGVVAPDAAAPLSERLLALHLALVAVVARWAPDEAAIEETFVTANGSSTLKLGHARAAAMLAPAAAGLPVAEYAAKVVKKALVGTGAADKDQIAFMVARLLPAAGGPTQDAADALAVAICHAHARLRPSGYGAASPRGAWGAAVADLSRRSSARSAGG
jgi:crossover junction endodeoxyribonuclease RuvC